MYSQFCKSYDGYFAERDNVVLSCSFPFWEAQNYMFLAFRVSRLQVCFRCSRVVLASSLSIRPFALARRLQVLPFLLFARCSCKFVSLSAQASVCRHVSGTVGDGDLTALLVGLLRQSLQQNQQMMQQNQYVATMPRRMDLEEERRNKAEETPTCAPTCASTCASTCAPTCAPPAVPPRVVPCRQCERFFDSNWSSDASP